MTHHHKWTINDRMPDLPTLDEWDQWLAPQKTTAKNEAVININSMPSVRHLSLDIFRAFSPS